MHASLLPWFSILLLRGVYRGRVERVTWSDIKGNKKWLYDGKRQMWILVLQDERTGKTWTRRIPLLWRDGAVAKSVVGRQTEGLE